MKLTGAALVLSERRKSMSLHFGDEQKGCAQQGHPSSSPPAQLLAAAGAFRNTRGCISVLSRCARPQPPGAGLCFPRAAEAERGREGPMREAVSFPAAQGQPGCSQSHTGSPRTPGVGVGVEFQSPPLRPPQLLPGLPASGRSKTRSEPCPLQVWQLPRCPQPRACPGHRPVVAQPGSCWMLMCPHCGLGPSKALNARGSPSTAASSGSRQQPGGACLQPHGWWTCRGGWMCCGWTAGSLVGL